MTNQERVADLIYSHMSSWDDEVQAMNATQDLTEAGLLMSDLPVQDEEEWEYGVQSREYSEHAKMWSGWGHFAIPFEKQRTRESCEQFIKGRRDPRFEYRLVRRRVSPTYMAELT